MSQLEDLSQEQLQKQLEIDKFYLREAYRFASKHSDDPIAQNGAVIVKNNKKASLDNILVYGANHFPKGIKKTPERLENKTIKLFYIEHAERDAIFNALQLKYNLEGTIMYCPWITCSDCARTIIRFGIKELIGHTGPEKFYEEVNKEKLKTSDKKSSWKDSIDAGFSILKECEINYRFVDGKIGGVEIIFAREKFCP